MDSVSEKKREKKRSQGLFSDIRFLCSDHPRPPVESLDENDGNSNDDLPHLS